MHAAMELTLVRSGGRFTVIAMNDVAMLVVVEALPLQRVEVLVVVVLSGGT